MWMHGIEFVGFCDLFACMLTSLIWRGSLHMYGFELGKINNDNDKAEGEETDKTKNIKKQVHQIKMYI